jgi:Immunity protein 26
MVKVGDIFEIPISENRKAYGHFVFKDKSNGPMIQVFDLISDKGTFIVQDVINNGYLFPPVVTGLNAAIRVGMWRIVGKLPIIDFVYPRFVSAVWDYKSGEVKNWFLWDGEKFNLIGSHLLEEYKSLEYLVVWSPYDIVYRIETGLYPYPYGEMIKNNRFTPIQKKEANTP